MNNLGTLYLYTKRCILRRFERTDSLGVFNSYSSDKNIYKYLNNNPDKNIFETEFSINQIIYNYNNLNYYNWIIVNQINNEIIGTVSLHNVDCLNDSLEMGIIITKKYQNQGYGKEVINELINFAFNRLNVFRMEVKVMTNNLASNKLFRSMGFNFEGVIHGKIKKDNNFYDINQYYLLNI